MNNNKRAYIFALIAVFFWGTSASAFKIGLKHVDHFQLLFIATLTSVIFLFTVLIIQKKLSAITQFTFNDFLKTSLLGFLNPFLYYVVLFKAYSLLPAQVAQPLNFVWPIALVLLSAPILKQKLSFKSIIALFISFIGVILISSEGNISNLNFANPLGVTLALSSSIVWALFWLLNVKNKKDEVVQLFLNFLIALLLITILTYKYSSFEISNIKGIFFGIYIGLFEMGITFVLWLKALKLADRTDKVSNLIYLTPFYSLIFISLILKENIYITTLFGLILIVTGIVIQQNKKIKI
jgi:drug/metabolite transporter (DMT)-like permease